MRLATSLFLVGSVAFAACAGETSSLMSVWNDSGVGGQAGATPTGGAAGHRTGGTTGGNVGGTAGFNTGGASGMSGGAGGNLGTIAVVGGVRDLATGQCTAVSGGACMTAPSSITCAHDHCETTLRDCYYPTTTTGSFTGQCAAYGNCLLGCPCDGRKAACENGCLQNYASPNPDCSTCLLNLGVCMGLFGCSLTADCPVTSSGGVAGSVGPIAGSSGGQAGRRSEAGGGGGAVGGAIGGAAGGFGGAGGAIVIVTPDASPIIQDAGPGVDLLPDVRYPIDRLRTVDTGSIVISLDARPVLPILP